MATKTAMKPALGSTVRIIVPRDVAFNLGRFQKSLRSVGEMLGHPQCLSGVHCLFEFEMDYRINPQKLRVEPVAH